MLAKDVIIKAVLEGTCVAMTGVRADIGIIKTDVIKGVLDIRGLRLYNPKGYPPGLMADVPELYADIDWPELLHNKIKLEELRFYLKEFNIVRIARGEVNVNNLIPPKPKKGADKKQLAKGFLKITVPGTLSIRADKVFFKDYTLAKEPIVNEFDINIDQRYENVEDVYSLIDKIGTQFFKETAVANFMNVPISKIKNKVSSTYQKGSEAVYDTVKGAASIAKRLFSAVKNKA